MTITGWIQILLFFAVLILLVKPLGSYMAKVLEGKKTFLTPVLGVLERGIYRICGIDGSDEMDWKTYTLAFLLFSLVGIVFLYL
ncbi:MAG: potassium-transporting ATPase subunit KdpA, partial [Anaerolineaceae bacterium]